jgi:hypothetical protein
MRRYMEMRRREECSKKSRSSSNSSPIKVSSDLYPFFDFASLRNVPNLC